MMKKLWYAALVAMVCAVTSQAELVGHWRMGEAGTFDGTNWTIPDQAASPANGVSSGMAETNRVEGAPLSTEIPTYGLYFDEVDYVGLGTPAKLNLTNTLTVTAWVNPSGLQGAGAHADFQPIVGKGDNQYMLRYHRGSQDFHFFVQGNGWQQVDAAPNAGDTFPPNAWYFVVGRADLTAASNNVSVWVNGVVGGQANSTLITASGDTVDIGRNSTNPDRVFNGVIDDVRIFNHALSDQEILDLYAERIAPPEVTQEPVIAPRDYVVEGTEVTITSAIDGTEPIVIQWLKDGLPVVGETNEVLTIPSVVVGDAGDYSVSASSIYGAVTSEVATLNVGPAGAVTFFEQPVGATRYINGSVTFSTIVVGDAPLSLQWTLNGGDISGATNETLTVSDIETADDGDYVLVATAGGGAVTENSDAATLTVLVPDAGSYAEAVVNAGPIAYWRMEETGGTTANEYMSGWNGTHFGGVTPNVAGPRPPALPDLPADNLAADYDGDTGGTDIGVSIMNARPAFTIMGWFNPGEMPQVTTTNLSERVGLFGQNDVAEFGFHGGTTLGCWSPGGFVSFDPTGIVLPNQWYFIACTGDGTNMNLFLDAGRVSAIQNVTADYGSSTSPFRIGYAILDAQNNWFDGMIDEVAVYDRALSAQEISDIRSAAGPVPPVVAEEPVDVTRYAGLTAEFSVNVAGTLPIGYQWRKGGVPLVDGGDISGANTAALTISNVEAGDAGSYDVVATNDLGTATSSAASLTVVVPDAGSYEEAVVALKPIAYWTMNETTGLTGFDYAGGYDLTHNSFVILDEPGPQPPTYPGMEAVNPGWFGEALGPDEGSATTASIMNNRSQFTIMGWMNPAQMPALSYTASGRVALFGQNDVAEFGFHGDNVLGIWTPQGGYSSVNVTNNSIQVPLIEANNWYFLTAVGDGSTLKLYVNGTEVASVTDAASPTIGYGNSTSPFRVGYGVLDTAGNEFYGGIDEVAVFADPLSASEIQTLYGLAADQFFPVELLQQPTDVTLYEGAPGGANFSVLAAGTGPLSYAWRKGGSPLSDGGSVSGSLTDMLSISPVTLADQGDYDVVVSNDASTETSDTVSLTVIEVTADSYEESVLGLDPAGYWRLNEPVDSTVAIEAWNGRNGTIRSNAVMGVEGVTGNGFEPGNTAVQTTAGTAESDVALPSMGFNSDTATIACWVKLDGNQSGFSGIVFLRAGGTVSGMHFGNANENQLRYSWNDQYWDFDGGPTMPTNEWVFAALVVEPTHATLHLGVNGAMQTAVNTASHGPSNFNNSPMYIGWDPNSVGRHFNGSIDEVMVVDRALSTSELQNLYFSVVGDQVLVEAVLDASGNIMLSWPAGANLESATEVDGTWSPVTGATSPFTIEPTLPQEFYRLVE